MNQSFIFTSLITIILISGCYDSSEPPLLERPVFAIVSSIDNENFQKNSAGDIVGPSRLVWKETVSGLKTYDASAEYCDNLGNGWRIPKREELLNLIAYTEGNGGEANLLKNGFNVNKSSSWAKDRYFVNFKSGSDDLETNTTALRPVLCVYGKSALNHIYQQDLTDINITIDKSVNLEWYKSSKKLSIEDNNASEYCSNLGTNWRIPNINELRSLVNYKNIEVPSTIFSQNDVKIWSGTVYSNGDGTSNYYLDMSQNATIDSEKRSQRLGVACVREH